MSIQKKKITTIENIIKNSKPCPTEFMEVLEKTFKRLISKTPTRL